MKSMLDINSLNYGCSYLTKTTCVMNYFRVICGGTLGPTKLAGANFKGTKALCFNLVLSDRVC